ncbi:MAG: hypothetical protein LBL82_00180 [Oscillospiraceae bacterium]|jgi:hypothetical protein|nr:hypothetical protein [Oscillospiraceae bacterium]
MLEELLSNAIKRDVEIKTFPLWIADYAFCKLRGVPATDYAEYQENIFKNTNEMLKTKRNNRTPEEIINEFAPIIAADKEKH